MRVKKGNTGLIYLEFYRAFNPGDIAESDAESDDIAELIA